MMFIPCSVCCHVKQGPNEEGLIETYCEVLDKRGKMSFITDENMMGIMDPSKTCDSFSWDKNIYTIIKALADLWNRVWDIEHSKYRLVRLPRDK